MLVIPSAIFAIWGSIILYDTIKVDNSMYNATPSNRTFTPGGDSFDKYSKNNTSSEGEYLGRSPLLFQCSVLVTLFALVLVDWFNVLVVSFGGEICERLSLWRWKQKKLKENPSLMFSDQRNHIERSEMEDGNTNDDKQPAINETWMDDDDICEISKTTCISHGSFLIIKWLIVGVAILGLFAYFTVQFVSKSNQIKSNIKYSNSTSSVNYASDDQFISIYNNTDIPTGACAVLLANYKVDFYTNQTIVTVNPAKSSSLSNSISLYMIIRWIVLGLSLLISLSTGIGIGIVGWCTYVQEAQGSSKRKSRASVGENVTYHPLATVSDNEE